MTYAFDIGQATSQRVASIRVTTTPAELGPTLAQLLTEVAGYLVQEGLRPAGPPFARYHDFGPELVDLEAGFPVTAHPRAVGRVQVSELPGGRMANTWHVGPYDSLNKAYEALIGWITSQGLNPAGAPWDIYWTDPGLVPDPQGWKTEIRWPIR